MTYRSILEDLAVVGAEPNELGYYYARNQPGFLASPQGHPDPWLSNLSGSATHAPVDDRLCVTNPAEVAVNPLAILSPNLRYGDPVGWCGEVHNDGGTTGKTRFQVSTGNRGGGTEYFVYGTRATAEAGGSGVWVGVPCMPYYGNYIDQLRLLIVSPDGTRTERLMDTVAYYNTFYTVDLEMTGSSVRVRAGSSMYGTEPTIWTDDFTFNAAMPAGHHSHLWSTLTQDNFFGSWVFNKPSEPAAKTGGWTVGRLGT